MGFWARVADWLEPPLPHIYGCVACERRFREPHEACPECGGEVEKDMDVAYWYGGPL